MNKYKITIYLNDNTQDSYIVEALDIDEALLIEGSLELNYKPQEIKDIDIDIII